jgi:ribosomal protein L40E
MADYVDKGLERMGITLSKPVLAMICIIFGIVVIVLPNLLVWIVGLFLMVQGILLLTDLLETGRTATPAIAHRGSYCTHCGTGNVEEAVYCKKCGQTLERTKQQNPQSKPKRAQN